MALSVLKKLRRQPFLSHIWQRRDDPDPNSPGWARIVRALTFFFVCLFAALSFEGCSQPDRQRSKDDAARKAIVGDWDWADSTNRSGIMRLSSDGTLSTSAQIVEGSSVHTLVAEGKWNITNGELVKTDLKTSWNGDKPLKFGSTEQERIVRITDKELALAFEVAGVYETNFYVTNNFRRAK